VFFNLCFRERNKKGRKKTGRKEEMEGVRDGRRTEME